MSGELAASRMPEAMQEIDMARGAIDSLVATVTDAEKRLTAVVRPEVPSLAEAAKPSPPTKTPLGSSIRGLADELRNQTFRLRAILDRLEV